MTSLHLIFQYTFLWLALNFIDIKYFQVADPETRKTLGPNQRGEICLRGPVFMKGYIGVPPSKYLDEQGFFQTGDLGYYDDDKYFFIVERLKEVLVYDGYKVSCSI